MRRRIGVVVAALVLAAGLGVPAAGAQAHMLVGIQDDALTLYGNPTFTFPLLRTLRVQIIRINLIWGGTPYGVANNRRPAHPQDPADPAYDWTLYDRAVRYAAQSHIQVLFSILFTPKWANGGAARNVPPRRYADLQNFAYAAAERYSGHYIPTEDNPDQLPLPAVKKWLAWNEPNNPVWLKQASGGHFTSPRSYAQICTAVWRGVHYTNFAGERVACGATGPRGNNAARSSRPSMSPLAFMRAARKAGMRHLDAYAHHPYYGRPSESPGNRPSGGAVELGNLRTLIAQSNRLFGRKPIWITEYGYQTRPPDRIFGVSYGQQARYLTEAYAIARHTPQVQMMIWFMLRDDTNLNIGWQSGLLTASGKKKPAFNAFRRLPH
ncbi:MAG TPA: glycosyl hydrolase [Gaiellaceae bacterium]|nr:glycosyl hydrolase [Gaiellaceae bacterium]